MKILYSWRQWLSRLLFGRPWKASLNSTWMLPHPQKGDAGLQAYVRPTSLQAGKYSYSVWITKDRYFFGDTSTLRDAVMVVDHILADHAL